MSDPVILRREGAIGRITLNRPDALHALNTPMCETIHRGLADWAEDDAIALVMIDHAEGTRGFCAGGDIRMLAESGAGDARAAREFFAAEYRMNAAIKQFPKPCLAMMDGVTMGGGVGISVHGSHRVATERTVFAMPETGIGLFPDVGGGWFLPRLPGQLGTWLALTGTRLKGSDVTAARIATHYLPSELLAHLRAQLAGADFAHGAAELLGEILTGLAHPVADARFTPHMETLNRCFAGDSAESILEALSHETADGDWAASQLETLRTKSPETVKLALRQLREGARLTRFEDNMAMEYAIAWRKVQSHDFLEGVRAVIMDKDNTPDWQPARIEDVTEADIARYFKPLGTQALSFTTPDG